MNIMKYSRNTVICDVNTDNIKMKLAFMLLATKAIKFPEQLVTGTR